MNKLYTTIFGSHLYGTNTPASDRDYKTVYLPPLENLVLGKGVKNIQQTTGSNGSKNTADDVDEEFIPLQVFMNDFFMGQSYALEIAFSAGADRDTTLFTTEKFVAVCYALKTRFLTKRVSALLGYINGQAIKYGVKGKRLEAAEAFQHMLDGFNDEDKLSVISDAVKALGNEYIFLDTYLDGTKEVKQPCVSVLEKIYPMTITIREAKARTEGLIKQYGHRAVKARDMQGHDWKALSHAVRLGYQIIELLSEHKITLPLKPMHLRTVMDVKNGLLDFEVVHEIMAVQLTTIDAILKTTSLPSEEELRSDFSLFLTQTLLDFYNLKDHKYE